MVTDGLEKYDEEARPRTKDGRAKDNTNRLKDARPIGR